MMLIAILSIDDFLVLTVFLVPVSVQLRFLMPDVSADLFLPTEIMLAIILVLMLFKVAVTREVDKRILTHPVTVIGLIMLVWSLVTSLTGTMPVVSLKSFITRLWFFSGFYLLAAITFRHREKLERYFKAYLLGMMPVVIYFIINMWHSGLLNRKATFNAVRPFFNDHTAFGASLAFCLPMIIFFIFKKGLSGIQKLFFIIALPLFSLAFVLSYSRAAWLSLAAAAFLAAVILLRISWKVIVPGLIFMVVMIIISWSSIVLQFSDNRQASSADLARHLKSVSNITTDDSNRERINRWKSAIKMTAEKPLLGWGPGAYQFRYAPFQLAADKTAISTNYGEVGNAHSEYLGALSESGIPGMILYIMLLISCFVRGIHICRAQGDRQRSLLAVALIAGITTYAVHGALNNFLDSDKISALFWGMIAAITALDIGNYRVKN
jgi:O-antigen ligase